MSLFSQSLLLGDDTFGELEQQHNQQQPSTVRPPESQGIIEESPNSNQTADCRMRSRMTTIRHTQKSKRGVMRTASDSKLGALQHPRNDEAADNFSAFFRSDLEFKENSGIVAQQSCVASDRLDRYFGESIDFNETTKSSRTRLKSGRRLTVVPDDPDVNAVVASASADLGDMFAKSDFFTQANSADETLNNASATRLDMPISTEDLCDLSFDDSHSNFNIQTGPCSTRVPVAAEGQQREPTTMRNVQPAAENAEIVWEDSADFANTFSGETNPSVSGQEALESIPDTVAPVVALSNVAQLDEEFAQGIDNVTFTQDFLRPRSMEPDRIADDNIESTERSSVNQFIQHEMDKCQRLVSRGLTDNSNANMNESMFNVSATSDMVLNYSADSASLMVKRNTSVVPVNPQPVAEPKRPTDRPKELPSQNLNQIDQWGLSPSVVEQYHRKGIRTMFDWQVECLSNTKVKYCI